MRSQKQNDIIYKSLGIDELIKNNIPFKEVGGYKYFVFGEKTPFDFFSENFHLEKGTFLKKYNQSITGSGQPENDFAALHSSALCALLCFYNIDNKPITIDGVKYNKSFFEVKNKVFSYGRGLSNMDVVLISEDNDTILFLECKFSEYLKNSVEHNLSEKYFKDNYTKKLYDAVASPCPKKDNKPGEYVTLDGNTYCFYIKKAYTQGVKQIISHLKGLQSFLNRNKEKDYYGKIYKNPKNGDVEKRVIFKKEKYNKVLFKELIFKLNDCKQFNDYKELSKEVRKKLIKVGMGIETDEEFVFEKPITYQEIFTGENLKQLDPSVVAFYCFNKNK